MSNGQEIPRIIHFIWLNFKERNRDCIVPDKVARIYLSWAQMNPNFTITLWNDSMALKFVQDNFSSDIYKCYTTWKSPIYQVDMLKILILFKIGGFYIDSDADPMGPLEPLVDCKCQLLLSKEGGHINNAFMASGPGQQFWLNWLKFIMKAHKNPVVHRAKTAMGVLWCTGPLGLFSLLITPSTDGLRFLNKKESKEYFIHNSSKSWVNVGLVFDILLVFFAMVLIALISTGIYFLVKFNKNKKNSQHRHNSQSSRYNQLYQY